ncbi:hypothetical protein CRENBAI_021311 [Crenichthys baileyi]|uniref:Uncharacterized protein n=1 Tax=Crenichthys baileyi TaxID=28760 RepID=A0AAV9RCT7_9TELE
MCRCLGNLLPAAYSAYSPDGPGAPCEGVQQVSLIITQVLKFKRSEQSAIRCLSVFLTSWLQSRCRSSGKIPSTPDFKLLRLLSSSWLTPRSKPPSNVQANLAHPPTPRFIFPPPEDFLQLHSLVCFQSRVRYLKLSVKGK